MDHKGDQNRVQEELLDEVRRTRVTMQWTIALIVVVVVLIVIWWQYTQMVRRADQAMENIRQSTREAFDMP